MLKHEPAEIPVPSAADARVTPDELNAALKTLEDTQNSTVAIGSVVDELRLNATPEQIWEQVQAQREQKLAQGTIALTPPTQVAAPPPFLVRYSKRILVLLAVSGSLYSCFFVLNPPATVPAITTVRTAAPTPQPAMTTSGQTITFSGDGQNKTLPVKSKDVVVTGSGDNLTLQGQARSVIISGDRNNLQGDAPKASDDKGSSNNVKWTKPK